ncbi:MULTISPECIES: hypothetical protein [unclassified Leucobacter]|uniref:hypothetical protein n=1 Tax=unclassified Leucobacter TaxID=2621730 RepID=UPI0006219E41|nr:hypothetical protein [Leucobacter sp. Ag1]KKI20549.1 hypothetical protein XM48_07450 [Leucobacter sp. Ag1]
MADWALVAIVALILAYRLAGRWLDERGQESGETPPPGSDTLVETAFRETRDDGERRIPDIQLGFQREKP